VLLAIAAFLADASDYELPKFNPSPKPYIALLAAGFLIGALGHLFKAKVMIATGIMLIFSATILIPLYVQLTR
jgi:hypothetical protein